MGAGPRKQGMPLRRTEAPQITLVGNRFVKNAPHFIAPLKRSLKMYGFGRATFYRATETILENGSVHMRHKDAPGKWFV